ncbi:hypothetical protein NQ317_014454 [Molorchus minor]|uniref:Photosystem I P700 apoprotein A2 n=1 Tax=Molorchus minor TaxID=1323400 RepID=A0ABQ9J642_9CUCU|nr:hypothetical protein NQ317_014454 [Molorchus minor]
MEYGWDRYGQGLYSLAGQHAFALALGNAPFGWLVGGRDYIEGYASLLPQYALLSADSLAIAFGTITFVFSFFACCGSWFRTDIYFLYLPVFYSGSINVRHRISNGVSSIRLQREPAKHNLREELQNGILHHYNMTSRGPNSLVQIWDNIQTKAK